MHTSLKLLTALTLCFAAQNIWADTPSNIQVINWISNLDESNANPKNDITIDNMQEIRLYSGEVAYLSGVRFENAARNFWGGYVLTRPSLSESRILNFGGQSNTFRTHRTYKNNKQFDLVEFESGGSGQGRVEQSIDLTYIHNWQVNTLHTVHGGSYEGSYDDITGDIDCKTAFDHYVFLNLIPFAQRVIETSVETDGCENKSKDDYQIKSSLIEFKIP